MTVIPEAQASLDRAIRAKEEKLLTEKAIALVERYLTKPRRGGGTARLHAAAVGSVLAKAGAPIDLIIAGLLHDVLEDAGDHITYRDLETQFGFKVAELVLVLTKTGNDAKHERRYLQKIEMVRGALIIKLVDNADNLYSARHLKRPREYLKYAKKIQAMGARRLGENDPFVLHHLSRLRDAELSISSMPS